MEETFGEKLSLKSFRALGIASLLFAFGAILLAFGATPGVVGFFIFLPGTMIMIPALVLGPGLSLFIWHNQRLNLMKALLLFVAILMFIFQKSDWVALLIFLAFGVTCSSIGTDILTSFLNRIGWNHK